MLRRVLPLVVVALSATTLLSAQATPEKKPAFEVASIKPNKDTSGGRWSTSGGRQTFIATTATGLIMSAFKVHDYEIVGAPSWSDTERFDVIAQAEGKPKAEELRLMMQSLLEERFALRSHRETREGPVYRLVLARKDGTLGPQLLKSDRECGTLAPASVPWLIAACSARTGMADAVFGATELSSVVNTLESLVDRRIIDETGLTGRFDAKLEWSRGQSDLERPSIFTAIQEQLGLKLEPERRSISVVVIDSISRPTPD